VYVLLQRGAQLLYKLGGVPPRGFGIAIAESGRGLGISLADSTGVSVHEELGRALLADGEWHHACVVLQRGSHPQLTVFVDGRSSERLSLRGSRLRRLGSVDSESALLVGRRDDNDAASSLHGAMREVALWSRPLLPEHAAVLHRDGLPAPPEWRHQRQQQQQQQQWRHRQERDLGGNAAGVHTFALAVPPGSASATIARGSAFDTAHADLHAIWPWRPPAAVAVLLSMLLTSYALRRRRLHAKGASVGRSLARGMLAC
jgi:hypothetical protein